MLDSTSSCAPSDWTVSFILHFRVTSNKSEGRQQEEEHIEIRDVEERTTIKETH